MKTFEYLFSDEPLFLPAFGAGLAIALSGALLSVFVVTRRLAFVGQAISHAAFAGVGFAVWLGLAGGGSIGQAMLVGMVCLATGWLIGWLSSREDVSDDSAIGILLVAAMAIGALLVHMGARRHGAQFVPSWEEILFGSILAVGGFEAMLAWIASGAIALTMVLARRPLLVWAYDEQAARASGVRVGLVRLLLLTLLSLFIVVAMRLAGVVLVTALLVLPSAAALRLSSRLVHVFMLSGAISITGMLGGLVASFELDAPPGACVVLLLVGLFALASAIRIARDRRSIQGSARALPITPNARESEA